MQHNIIILSIQFLLEFISSEQLCFSIFRPLASGRFGCYFQHHLNAKSQTIVDCRDVSKLFYVVFHLFIIIFSFSTWHRSSNTLFIAYTPFWLVVWVKGSSVLGEQTDSWHANHLRMLCIIWIHLNTLKDSILSM